MREEREAREMESMQSTAQLRRASEALQSKVGAAQREAAMAAAAAAAAAAASKSRALADADGSLKARPARRGPAALCARPPSPRLLGCPLRGPGTTQSSDVRQLQQTEGAEAA